MSSGNKTHYSPLTSLNLGWLIMMAYCIWMIPICSLTINKNPLTPLKFYICVEKLFSQDTSSYPKNKCRGHAKPQRCMQNNQQRWNNHFFHFWNKWTGPPSENITTSCFWHSGASDLHSSGFNDFRVADLRDLPYLNPMIVPPPGAGYWKRPISTNTSSTVDAV